jgi:hypothetical protein
LSTDSHDVLSGGWVSVEQRCKKHEQLEIPSARTRALATDRVKLQMLRRPRLNKLEGKNFRKFTSQLASKYLIP